jgi:hypothetical protein
MQLVEKYKPLTLKAFAGVDRPKAMLTAFVAKPYTSAWLLEGPSGLGKTTMAFAAATARGASQFHRRRRLPCACAQERPGNDSTASSCSATTDGQRAAQRGEGYE